MLLAYFKILQSAAKSCCAQTLRGAPLTEKRLSTHGVKFTHESAGFPWLYYITMRHGQHNTCPKLVYVYLKDIKISGVSPSLALIQGNVYVSEKE